jgi:cytoskeletal protein CcmA (bactofilin family)
MVPGLRPAGREKSCGWAQSCVYCDQSPDKNPEEREMAVVDTPGAPAAIGKSVQIRGEVNGSEDLLVDGVVEGTITLSDNRLTVGPNARVSANVAARDVVLLGTLIGDIQASGRVELRAGSNLTGDIRSARLSIEENAMFSGKVDLLQGAQGISERGGVIAQTPSGAPAKAGTMFNAPMD